MLNDLIINYNKYKQKHDVISANVIWVEIPVQELL